MSGRPKERESSNLPPRQRPIEVRPEDLTPGRIDRTPIPPLSSPPKNTEKNRGLGKSFVEEAAALPVEAGGAILHAGVDVTVDATKGVIKRTAGGIYDVATFPARWALKPYSKNSREDYARRHHSLVRRFAKNVAIRPVEVAARAVAEIAAVSSVVSGSAMVGDYRNEAYTPAVTIEAIHVPVPLFENPEIPGIHIEVAAGDLAHMGDFPSRADQLNWRDNIFFGYGGTYGFDVDVVWGSADSTPPAVTNPEASATPAAIASPETVVFSGTPVSTPSQ